MDLPEYLRLYVFGSAVLSPDEARDLDLLVVYDRTRVRPDRVYCVISELLSSLGSIVGLPVHPAVLTKEEAEVEHFIEDYDCMPFEVWAADRLMKPSTNELQPG